MLRVVPPHQRLEPDRIAGLRIDLGLVDHLEVRPADDGVQVAVETQALDRMRVEIVPVLLNLAAVGLGSVEGDVGPLHQRLDGVAVLRVDGEADACLDAQADPVGDQGFA